MFLAPPRPGGGPPKYPGVAGGGGPDFSVPVHARPASVDPKIARLLSERARVTRLPETLQSLRRTIRCGTLFMSVAITPTRNEPYAQHA
jgi:hypothetical protein